MFELVQSVLLDWQGVLRDAFGPILLCAELRHAEEAPAHVRNSPDFGCCSFSFLETMNSKVALNTWKSQGD